MRSFATLTITLLSLYHHCNGFYSHITNLPRHHGVPAEVTVKIARVDRPITLITLGAMNKDDTAEEETKTVNYHPLRLANVAIALALASTIGASSGIAYEYSQPSTTASSSMTSSSTQLGASYSDSDFADFSLPSYQDVASAEINTNLKGGKELMGDQYKYKATTSSSRDTSLDVPDAIQTKEPTAADLKAEKAAAKAAQKAARERQQAAVEAAAASNK